MIDKTKLKSKLEEKLKRKATADELINAEKDSLLLQEVLFETIENHEQRLKALEP